MRVAEAITNALAQPFVIGGGKFHVSASIGAAIYPTHGRTFWTGMRPMGDWGAEVCGAFTPGTLPPSGAARTHVGSLAAYARMLMASTLTAPGSTSESTSCGRSHALSHSSR